MNRETDLQKYRCPWSTTPLYHDYHDKEWGRPLHEDKKLFEMLCLEGMQAGLSWLTVLNKRENFRKAFDNFEPSIIAGYGEDKIVSLMQDSGIIRNRLKIHAVIGNARAYHEVVGSYGSFDEYIWRFVSGRPIKNAWKDMSQIPAATALSDKMSRELKKDGFKFVGSTIIYAYMQAVGMVNDHLTTCFLYDSI